MSVSQNVLAIVRSNESSTALNETCKNMNGTRVNIHVGGLVDVRPDNEMIGSPDVLFLEVNPESEDDLKELKVIIEERFPGTPIVATATDASLRAVRQLIHIGIADFLPQPFSREDLLGALNQAAQTGVTRAARQTSSGDAGGRVITFLKGGGGVGATTLAVHSACLLASDKSAPRTCILDFDIQFGTAALYLDLETRNNIADLLDDSPDRMDGALLRGAMSHHECGVDVLAVPPEVMPLDTLTTDFVEQCLKVARREYDYVFVDLPESWTVWSYAVLRDCDLIMLVTHLNVAGVRQAKRQIETLRLQELGGKPIKLVLNRAEKGLMKSRQQKMAEKALGRSVDYFVPDDFDIVAEALNRGVPLGEVKRHSKIEKAIQVMTGGFASVWAETGARAEARLA
jgi:pilus assembly protein CpaE